MSDLLDGLMRKLIAQLEAGAPPWRQPWSGGRTPSAPVRADGARFSGQNAWTLAFVAALRGYTSPWWFTFNQARAIGAAVMKGSHATPALLYKHRVAEEMASELKGDNPRIVWFLKSYGVFNAEQLAGCPEQYLEASEPPLDAELRDAASNAVLDAVPAKIEHGGLQAAYFPKDDLIRLPPPERFEGLDHYRATKAHELVHWTSHASRLDRRVSMRLGDEAHAFEELVAEIGSALLGLQLGVAPAPLDGHAAYLAGWLKILEARPSALMNASAHAQRAVDFLLAFSPATAAAEEPRNRTG